MPAKHLIFNTLNWPNAFRFFFYYVSRVFFPIISEPHSRNNTHKKTFHFIRSKSELIFHRLRFGLFDLRALFKHISGWYSKPNLILDDISFTIHYHIPLIVFFFIHFKYIVLQCIFLFIAFDSGNFFFSTNHTISLYNVSFVSDNWPNIIWTSERKALLNDRDEEKNFFVKQLIVSCFSSFSQQLLSFFCTSLWNGMCHLKLKNLKRGKQKSRKKKSRKKYYAIKRKKTSDHMNLGLEVADIFSWKIYGFSNENFFLLCEVKQAHSTSRFIFSRCSRFFFS